MLKLMLVLSWLPFGGCAGAGSLGAALGLVGLLATLVIGACSDSSGAGPTGDAAEDCDGELLMRCEAGQLLPVCCPAGLACNYYFFKPCGDTCIPYTDECTETADASPGESDAPSDVDCPSTVEQCEDGLIVTVCCPSDASCDGFATFVDCGDRTCVVDPATCP